MNSVIAWPNPEVLLSLLPKTDHNSTGNLHLMQILCIAAHLVVGMVINLFDQKWFAARGGDLGVLGSEAGQRGQLLRLGSPQFLES